jgi:hypothetical protein
VRLAHLDAWPGGRRMARQRAVWTGELARVHRVALSLWREARAAVEPLA